MNLYEAIFVRKSVRNYCFDTLPPQTLDKIWEHYKEMPALFSGIGVDMAILDNRKGQERMLSMFSVKAPYYMAFYSEESERYLMNVGYIMEQMVLYLCSIGLGTCFIGSNRVKKAELEKNGKRLVGIVAFGKSQAAMIHSCNPYFIALSQKLSAATLFQTAEKLGYGTEILLTDSMSADGGILPTLQDLKISAEKANFCFGQGMLTASPLQVARMTCAIANGGTLPQPRLIRGITKDGVSLVTKTETDRKSVV